MAFDMPGSGRRRQVRQEINLVPFIDVLLVLLVIFIVAAPLLAHAVRIELPRAASRPERVEPQDIAVGIAASGALSWNGAALDSTGLEGRLRLGASQVPAPCLRIRADARVPYARLAEVMATAARAGIAEIAFESDPRPQPPR
jgi:biopolymer transport protein ExbD